MDNELNTKDLPMLDQIEHTHTPCNETHPVGTPYGSFRHCEECGDYLEACESGWTGDRCTFPLFHEGPHSND